MWTNVAIALGSNLGNPLETLQQAVETLKETEGIEDLAISSWFSTKPVGPPQPDYVNGCITCRTNLEPEVLLQELLSIENQFGRERNERWGARTLDLDLILYGVRQINMPHLEVPHPRMAERAFVLVPLAEIAADWVDPNTKETIKALGDRLDQNDIRLFAK